MVGRIILAWLFVLCVVVANGKKHTSEMSERDEIESRIAAQRAEAKALLDHAHSMTREIQAMVDDALASNALSEGIKSSGSKSSSKRKPKPKPKPRRGRRL